MCSIWCSACCIIDSIVRTSNHVACPARKKGHSLPWVYVLRITDAPAAVYYNVWYCIHDRIITGPGWPVVRPSLSFSRKKKQRREENKSPTELRDHCIYEYAAIIIIYSCIFSTCIAWNYTIILLYKYMLRAWSGGRFTGYNLISAGVGTRDMCFFPGPGPNAAFWKIKPYNTRGDHIVTWLVTQ